MEFQLDTLENDDLAPLLWEGAGKAEAGEGENNVSMVISVCALE